MVKYVKEFDFPSDAGFSGSAGKQMVSGYARGGQPKGQSKVGKVMGEFGKGKLHSGAKSGPVVKNPKQAIAIALSEARKAGAKIPVKKAEGGPAEAKEPRSAYPKADTPQKKKAREKLAQQVMERAEKHAEELAKGPGYKKGGKIVEKGTGEVYASKAAMKRHEARESAAEEAAEHGKRHGGKMETKEIVSRETKASPRSMMEQQRTERMRRYEGQRPKLEPMVSKFAVGGREKKMATGGSTADREREDAITRFMGMAKSVAESKGYRSKIRPSQIYTSASKSSDPMFAKVRDEVNTRLKAEEDKWDLANQEALKKQAIVNARQQAKPVPQPVRPAVQQAQPAPQPPSQPVRPAVQQARPSFQQAKPTPEQTALKAAIAAKNAKIGEETRIRQQAALANAAKAKKYARGGDVKVAVHKHEKAMHPGKPLTKLRKGGMAC